MRQPHKMVKHTQTIFRLLPTNFLGAFDILWGWRLRGYLSVCEILLNMLHSISSQQLRC